jgi:hypothetical protein
MHAVFQTIKPKFPSLVMYGHSMYQESFSGTESSDLIYPLAQYIFEWGTQITNGNKDPNWTQRGLQVSILGGALLYGAVKKKNLPLIFGAILVQYVQMSASAWINKNIRVEFSENSEDSKDKIKHWLRARLIATIAYRLLNIYLKSKWNHTLTAKPYYFHAVACPLFMHFADQLVLQPMGATMETVIGKKKCLNGIARNVLVVGYVSSFAVSMLSAKCATWVTGQGVRMNSTVYALASATSIATEILLAPQEPSEQ